MTDTDIDAEWVTPAEAARRLGITRQAIRGRMERGTLETKPRGNRGVLVRLPPSIPVTPLTTTLTSTLPEPFTPNPLQDVVDRQREEIATLREKVARLEATDEAHREQITDLRAERDRLLTLTERLSEPWWQRWFKRS